MKSLQCPPWGTKELSAKKNAKAAKDQENAREMAKASPGTKGKSGASGKDVSRALRSVYDDTLREDVPDDFMDLLGKLK